MYYLSSSGGSDYVAANGSITITSQAVSPQCLCVPIIQDSAVEGAENFIITLDPQPFRNYDRLDLNHTANVTIKDDNDG